MEQEKREQQQQQPIPTVAPMSQTTPTTNLPPGAQPLPQQPQPDLTTVGVNPSMVTGQIVPNQPVGGQRAQAPGQLQKLQPQLPQSNTTAQTFLPRNGTPGNFNQSQVLANQRMVNPRQPGSVQQSWPPRHPQEVTLQQRGPATSSVPQGSMVPMQVANQQQPQMPAGSITGQQLGTPQQSQPVAPVANDPQSALRHGLASTAEESTPPPPLNNAPAPPAPPENPQTEEDRLKVSLNAFIAPCNYLSLNFLQQE